MNANVEAKSETERRNVEIVREYFRRLDGGGEGLTDLMHPDYRFWFPKFGFGTKQDLMACVEELMKRVAETAHDVDSFNFIASGNFVVVEGTSHGTLTNGIKWEGGKTSGGRFCNVYELQDGLIMRHHTYLDPDYGGEDEDRFLWGRDRNW